MSAELLKTSVLFKDFTPTGLGILGRIAHPKIVLAGQALFTEGGESEALYIVLAGRFRVTTKGTDGRELPIGQLGPGEHLGEMALLSDKKAPPHLSTATAEVDSKVLEIRLADFQQTMKEKPQACIKLMLAIAQDFGRRFYDTRETMKALLTRASSR